MRPARIIHRLGDHLALLEEEKPAESRAVIVKVLNGKQIKIGTAVVAYTISSVIHWTAFGKSRYSEDERGVAEAVAYQ